MKNTANIYYKSEMKTNNAKSVTDAEMDM